MPTTITVSRSQIEADFAALGIPTTSLPPVEMKGAGAAKATAPGVLDEDGDVFTIIGSVTGVVDDVADIIVPGAYTKTLTERKPKICFGHEWLRPIGKVLTIEELMPGDRRLPTTTAMGKPWPKEAGALVAKVKLFTNTTDGKEAAERWREYGPEAAFSIGYQVPVGKSKKRRDGVREIFEVALYEISEVLHGAMSLCGPMPTALAMKMLPGVEHKAASEPEVEPELVVDVKALHEAAEPGIDWGMVRHAAAVGLSHVVDVKAIAAQPQHRFEVGRKVSPEQMLAAAKSGAALGDGSYPIESEHDLRAALAHVKANPRRRRDP